VPAFPKAGAKNPGRKNRAEKRIGGVGGGEGWKTVQLKGREINQGVEKGAEREKRTGSATNRV